MHHLVRLDRILIVLAQSALISHLGLGAAGAGLLTGKGAKTLMGE